MSRCPKVSVNPGPNVDGKNQGFEISIQDSMEINRILWLWCISLPPQLLELIEIISVYPYGFAGNPKIRIQGVFSKRFNHYSHKLSDLLNPIYEEEKWKNYFEIYIFYDDSKIVVSYGDKEPLGDLETEIKKRLTKTFKLALEAETNTHNSVLTELSELNKIMLAHELTS